MKVIPINLDDYRALNKYEKVFYFACGYPSETKITSIDELCIKIPNINEFISDSSVPKDKDSFEIKIHSKEEIEYAMDFYSGKLDLDRVFRSGHSAVAKLKIFKEILNNDKNYFLNVSELSLNNTAMCNYDFFPDLLRRIFEENAISILNFYYFSDLSEENLNLIGSFVLSNNSLKHVRVYYYNVVCPKYHKISDEKITILSSFLNKSKSLEKISFHCFEFSESNIKLLADCLNSNTLINSLNFSCEFENNGLKTLFETIKTNENIEELRFNPLKINPQVSTYIADMVKSNQALKKLTMESIRLIKGKEAECLNPIADALKFNESLIQFDLVFHNCPVKELNIFNSINTAEQNWFFKIEHYGPMHGLFLSRHVNKQNIVQNDTNDQMVKQENNPTDIIKGENVNEPLDKLCLGQTDFISE